MRNLKLISDYLGCDIDLNVGQLCSDSRKVTPGDVFVATRGQVQDGRKYINQAVANGASAVLYENDDGFQFASDGIVAVGIENLERKLPKLAAEFYGNPSHSLKLIGITGTNGKSSTAYYIAQLFAAIGIRCGIVGTVGNGFIDNLIPSPNTTPGPIEIQQELVRQQQMGAEFVAMEVSSHGIAQGRINGLLFATTVFTNITRDHLDFHKTFEEYFAVKQGFILDNASVPVVVNIDDKTVASQLLPKLNDAQIHTVGIGAQFGISHIEAHGRGTSFNLLFDGSDYSISVPLMGAFNVYNVTEALAAVCCFSNQVSQLIKSLGQIKPLKGRMELFRNENSPLCLVDYAHTPDGLEKALLGARAHTSGKLICVVGCGGDRDKGKRPMMAQVASSLSDYIIFTDDNPRTEDPKAIVKDMLMGKITTTYEVIHDRRQAIEHALQHATEQDTVLVAGKGHEDYQIIGTVKHHFSDQEVLKEVLHL